MCVCVWGGIAVRGACCGWGNMSRERRLEVYLCVCEVVVPTAAGWMSGTSGKIVFREVFGFRQSTVGNLNLRVSPRLDEVLRRERTNVPLECLLGLLHLFGGLGEGAPQQNKTGKIGSKDNLPLKSPELQRWREDITAANEVDGVSLCKQLSGVCLEQILHRVIGLFYSCGTGRLLGTKR